METGKSLHIKIWKRERAHFIGLQKESIVQHNFIRLPPAKGGCRGKAVTEGLSYYHFE